MAHAGCLRVLVVDDVVRFALHLWRYLGRNVGFGIGTVRDDDDGLFYEGGRSRPLATADGRAKIWWIPADRDWEGRFTAIEREIFAPGSPRALILVDVKPKPRRPGEGGPAVSPYEAERVADWVRERADPTTGPEILVVSSYGGWPGPGSPLPKSPETFKLIESRLPPRDGDTPIGEGGWLDVLVTGAGFEMRHDHRVTDKKSGTRRGDQGFGLPGTARVLRGMGRPFGDEIIWQAEESEDDKNRYFPWTTQRAFFATVLQEQLRDLGQQQQLDQWWDLIFESELLSQMQKAGASAADVAKRRGVKRQTREFEYRMRDAYRQAILRYDWGHMAQSLHAAQLPWRAWLTTNYTGFANRAIAVVQQAQSRRNPPDPKARSWQIVSTASEAVFLMRQMQERDDGGRPSDRYLFKLHGDVGHLQTMAIAGHDKELFSTLSVPVDSLQQVYSAAESFLRRALEEQPKAPMRWHIVGHALRDQSLLTLIVRVARSSGQRRMEFRVVSRSPGGTEQRLRDALKAAGPSRRISVQPIEASAEGYMAGLEG